MLSTFINLPIILLSLLTATGLFLHDTRVDKATAVALTAPIASVSQEGTKPAFTNEAHTHVERNTFSQVMHAYQSAAPGIQPRHERKHLLQRYSPKGHHAFDNYNLPII